MLMQPWMGTRIKKIFIAINNYRIVRTGEIRALRNGDKRIYRN